MFNKSHRFVVVCQILEHKACKEPPSQNVAKAAPQARPQATGRAWNSLQHSLIFWIAHGRCSKILIYINALPVPMSENDGKRSDTVWSWTFRVSAGGSSS